MNPGAGGDVIASDEVSTLNGGASSGVKVQRVKAGYGVDGDFTDVSSTAPLPVSAKLPLTPAAPASGSAGTSSGLVLASNTDRKGLTIINLSSSIISFGLGGNAAVLNAGITLLPYGVWTMDEYTFNTGAINAIASAAASSISIQEFT